MKAYSVELRLASHAVFLWGVKITFQGGWEWFRDKYFSRIALRTKGGLFVKRMKHFVELIFIAFPGREVKARKASSF